MTSTESTIQGFIIFLVAAIIYIIPWAMAKSRKKRNSGAILALNLLLGWTVIGWIIAFIWALTKDD